MKDYTVSIFLHSQSRWLDTRLTAPCSYDAQLQGEAIALAYGAPECAPEHSIYNLRNATAKLFIVRGQGAFNGFLVFRPDTVL